jgi:GxxExxY protein
MTERLVDKDLLRRVGDVVVTAQHERDAHDDVVTHDGEVVDGRAVGSEDDEVVDATVVELGDAVHRVIPRGLAVRDLEAQGERLARSRALFRFRGIQIAAKPVVAELSFRAARFDLLGRAEAAIRLALLQQPVRVALVLLDTIRLMERALVPLEAQPLHAVEDRVRHFAARARAVRVFDPQHEDAVVTPRQQPIEKGRSRPADMQVSGRRGRKTNPELLVRHSGAESRKGRLVSLWSGRGRLSNLISRRFTQILEAIFAERLEPARMDDLRKITEIVIGSALRIHSALGPGMFESVYRDVLADDVRRKGLLVETEKIFPVVFEGRSFDRAFRVDLAVENKVLVELKSITQIVPIHLTQLLTYLRLLDCRV